MDTNERIHGYSLTGDYDKVHEFSRKGLMGEVDLDAKYLNGVENNKKIFLPNGLKNKLTSSQNQIFSLQLFDVQKYMFYLGKATSSLDEDRISAINYFENLCEIDSECNFIHSSGFLAVIKHLMGDANPEIRYKARLLCVNFRIKGAYPELKNICNYSVS